MNPFQNFDIDKVTARINLFTVNLHDYKVISPTVARVVLSYTGGAPTAEQIRARISQLFEQKASAVVDSFRQLTRAGEVKSIVGFIKASRDVVPFEDATADSGRYKAMASNLLMDNKDKSMWEIKSGATGKYLARQGNEDLSELVHLACASVTGIPKFNQVAKVPTQAKEFAAYIDLESEEVAHGYVIAGSGDYEEGKITVLSNESETAIEIDASQLVEVVDLDGEDEVAAGTKMAVEAGADRNAMIEYYKLMYRHSPDYIRMVIDCIDQHAFA